MTSPIVVSSRPPLADGCVVAVGPRDVGRRELEIDHDPGCAIGDDERGVADACAFIGGMHQVQTTGVRAEKVERALSRDGDSPWSALLAAFAHERSGEVGDMQTTLARAARLSDSPMTKALLAKSLRAVGKMRDAERLHETMRRELLQLRLRQTCQHPVFGPELAYAYTVK